MGRMVPSKVYSLDSDAVYISVREAARILDVSERSVYGYLAKGKLTRVEIEGMILLESAQVLAFERRAPGRTRERVPPWHIPPGRNPLYLMTMVAPLQPGCDALLGEKLSAFRKQGKHEIAGTCERAISRSLHAPDQLTIMLFWRGESLPPSGQREQEIAALVADLAEVCEWEMALISEGRAFAHTS